MPGADTLTADEPRVGGERLIAALEQEARRTGARGVPVRAVSANYPACALSALGGRSLRVWGHGTPVSACPGVRQQGRGCSPLSGQPGSSHIHFPRRCCRVRGCCQVVPGTEQRGAWMSPVAIFVGQGAVVLIGVFLAWVVATLALPARWSSIGWGILTWPLSQIARSALLIPLSLVMPSLLGTTWAMLSVVLLALTSGLFEESARWIVLRYWARRIRSWEQGVAFGLGHGGIEAILIIGMNAINSIVLLMTADLIRSQVAAAAPAQSGALEAQISSLQSVTIPLASAGVYERTIVTVAHIAFSILVLRAVQTGRWQWWALAVTLHCALNAIATAVMYGSGGNLLAAQGVLTLVTAGFAWAIMSGPLSRHRSPLAQPSRT